MRWLYATIGLIGGALSIAVTYLFFTFVMLMGGGSDAVGRLILYVVGAILLAALLNLAAAFLDPRQPAPRVMLLVSAVIWPLAGALIAFTKYFDSEAVTLWATLKFTALLAAPALLPLAAWAFARWKFPAARDGISLSR